MTTWALYGSPFSHTDQASWDFGRQEGDEVVYFRSIEDIVRAVVEEAVDQAVIPLSTALGEVPEATESLRCHEEIAIVENKERPIVQCLLGIEDAQIEDIETIISHPQALRQSEDALKVLCPQAVLEPYDSTSLAAEEVSAAQDPTLAAVGSPALADSLGLGILEETLVGEDNRTVFGLIRRKGPSTMS